MRSKRRKDRPLTFWLILISLQIIQCGALYQNTLNYSDNLLAGFIRPQFRRQQKSQPTTIKSQHSNDHDTYQYRSLQPEIDDPSNSVQTDSKDEYMIKIAVLMPENQSNSYEGGSACFLNSVLPAIEMGLNKSKQILNQYLVGRNSTTFLNFQLMYGDTKCSSVTGPMIAFHMVSTNKPDVFLGPICNYVLAPICRYSGVWDIPVITSGGLADAFTLKSKQYPTLTRMMGSYGHVSVALRGILDEFDWKIIALLYHNHPENSGKGNSDCYNSLSSIFRAVNSSAFHRSFDEAETTDSDFMDMFKLVQTKARIVILCANSSTIREMMLSAEELQMVSSGEYVFFNIELYSSTSSRPWYKESDTDERNERAKKAFSALLTVIAKPPDNDEYMTFSDEVKALAAEEHSFEFNQDEPVSIFVAAFYDAIMLYAHALRDYIEELPDALHHPLNGTRMVQLMWNRTFKGITGNVTINENGDRVSDYSLLDMNPETDLFEVVANYIQGRGVQYVEGKKIHWAGGREGPPSDHPVCGFDGSLCPDNSLHGYAILSLILGFVVIALCIISFLGYRHYRLEVEINSMTWKVNWNDVLPCNPSSNHRGSIHSMGRRGSQATFNSEDIGSLPGDRQLYIPIGFYKGNKVAIKKINPNNIVLDRNLMLELKRMKDIQHDHLVRFYGACVDPPDCYILTEYCPKGSLQDILENEQIKLDWMFKLSLMHDIIRGLHYLHTTEIGSHGSLKSSNCVVDSRFVLKITDFGLYELRKPDEDDECENVNSYAYWKRKLWTAPELLRLPKPPKKGTQKGDVYSLGIIVHEIVTRQGPFYLGMDDMSPQEVIENVIAKPNYYGAPFRPHIDDDTIDDVKIMMERCWSEEPAERPELRSLKLDIRKMNKENESGNILDNLLHRMEQYANNLESLVDERTRDYLDEKKKCEELLYQLLPKSVAAQLIMGRPVIAETFDMVTIYFSDIVGFTRISAESTPMQVVDFLNDLYTCFDSIVENFDVYKVETIGDAYMVVSGLPVKNGIEHAKEISRMALALLNAVQKFKIRHRPNEALKLRIGLHSGPCVAGVIGLKMPRYCLFGDTVNTASRMESNGEALKIHMSQSTKDLLDNFDGFEVAERGVMEIKGKGPMKTYWLLGEKYPFTPRLDKMMDDYPNFTASLINSNNYKYLNGGIHNSNNNINIVNNNLFRNVPTSISHTFLKGIGSNNQLKKKGIADDLSHVTQPLLVSK